MNLLLIPRSLISCPSLLCLTVFGILHASLLVEGKRNVCHSDVCQFISQRISQGIDESVDPCDNFFEYSCGNWMKKNAIPDDRSWWSPWSIARIRLKRQIRKMLEERKSGSNALPSVKQARRLYQGCLDMKSREAVGVNPLKQVLEKIGGWPLVDKDWKEENYNWVSAYIFLRSRLGLNYIFNMYVDIDSKNTSRRVIYLDRPGLGLGRSELQNPRDTQESRTLVSAYKTYIRNSAQKLNYENIPNSLISRDVNDMIRFEQRLALASSPLEDRRDHFSLYNKMTIAQLQQQFPGIRWLAIIKKIFKYAKVTVTDQDEVVVQDSTYYRNLPSILSSTAPRVIANYFGWRYVLGYSDYTTRQFTDTYFNFQRVAYGQRKPEKVWETCYGIVDTYFPFTVGRLYVDTVFNGLSKDAVETLVFEVRSAFKKEFDTYDWMDSFTRNKAKEKLDEMLVSIAYQPFLVNDTQLEANYRGMRKIDPTKFFSAILHLDRWQEIGNLRKLRKPVRRRFSKLSGSATVNAFNFFDLNYIQFPAGILQLPFYTFGGPASVNYGAIGKTIGHEIIHGFDDEGKQYDKTGNLRNWWTPRTEREYKKRSQCFIKEYDSFREPTTGLFVNGVDTQGENLADNGGLKMAFKAYKNYVNRYGDEYDPLLPGVMQKFAPEQLFFLSFASIWCENERRESMRNTLRYGSHSPSRFRVVGTVTNSEDFSNAFNCPLGSKMNPLQKCQLW